VPITELELETGSESVIPRRIGAVLDVTREDTDNHERDADLRSETYFDVAHYPTMTFIRRRSTREAAAMLMLPVRSR
jgi:hypothetical protein